VAVLFGYFEKCSVLLWVRLINYWSGGSFRRYMHSRLMPFASASEVHANPPRRAVAAPWWRGSGNVFMRLSQWCHTAFLTNQQTFCTSCTNLESLSHCCLRPVLAEQLKFTELSHKKDNFFLNYSSIQCSKQTSFWDLWRAAASASEDTSRSGQHRSVFS